jgi:hypothetical protein
MKFEAGGGTTEIRGAIYDVDAGPGGPLEELELRGRSGTYEPRQLVRGRTYEVLVNVVWSFVLSGGEETRLFRLRVEGP